MGLGTLVVVAIAAVAIVVVLAAIVSSKRKPVAVKVRGRALLTANELDFLSRLEAAVPEVRFHSQVAMGALLEPAFPKKLDPRAYMRIRGTFSQKILIDRNRCLAVSRDTSSTQPPARADTCAP